MELPPHESLKRELAEKFTANTTYIGSHVKKTIMETDFKVLKQSSITPTKIKKGDVIILQHGVKFRPCVIAKILKDKTCIYIPLTSTNNIHCSAPYKSRFFREGWFSKGHGVCSEDMALQTFAGVFDNMKDLNLAIKTLKEFITTNL